MAGVVVVVLLVGGVEMLLGDCCPNPSALLHRLVKCDGMVRLHGVSVVKITACKRDCVWRV